MNTCFSVVEDGAVVDDAATVPGDTDNGVEVDVVALVTSSALVFAFPISLRIRLRDPAALLSPLDPAAEEVELLLLFFFDNAIFSLFLRSCSLVQMPLGPLKSGIPAPVKLDQDEVEIDDASVRL